MKHKSKGKYKCSVCGKRLRTNAGMGRHLMLHVTKELFAYVDAHPNEEKSLPAQKQRRLNLSTEAPSPHP